MEEKLRVFVSLIVSFIFSSYWFCFLIEATLYWKSRPDLEAPDLLFCQVEFPVPANGPRRAASRRTGGRCSPNRPSRNRGRLRLQSADPAVALAIDANFLSDTRDLTTAAACVELCRALGNARAFAPFVRSEAMPGDLKGVDLDRYVREAAVTYWHQSCTTKMGRDEMSVVDGTLAVYGVSGLRVADASIMPRVTTGNTQAPCAIIGERAVEVMRENYGL